MITFSGCAIFLTPSHSRNIATVSELDSGNTKILVELPKIVISWGIGLGDQFKNAELSEEPVEIHIANKSGCEMIIEGVRIDLHIENGKKAKIYSGTLGHFWRNEGKFYCNTAKSDCDLKFILHLRFKKAGNKLKQPLIVTAGFWDGP